MTELVTTEDSEVERFMTEPDRFFDLSATAMHSVPRGRMLELQRAALARRFEQQRDRIPMVAKLAERQGITSLDEIEDVVPLLFEHTMYKSYPLALLERQQFDKLTSWMGKLTAVALSDVDVSACASIDGWVQTIADVTDVDVVFSSGTSGTMSFFPWSVRDLQLKWHCLYVHVLGYASSGDDPAQPCHYLSSSQRTRRNYMAEFVTGGQPEYCHMRNPGGQSADLGWLAARMRLAAARGDASRVKVPESLLARRAELKELKAGEEARDRSWQATLERLQGERIVWMVYPFEVYDLAVERIAHGERWTFAPESALVLIGGPKGREIPADWRSTVEQFLSNPVRASYGMTELSLVALECSAGRYHIPPWIVPLILDPETSALLPRAGVQRGRAAYFDLLPQDHWGGFMSGDEIEVDFDSACECGATTYHFAPEIVRLSDKRGGTDKISCAATPQAHAEAMQFLVGY
jgi:hypothetical protein